MLYGTFFTSGGRDPVSSVAYGPRIRRLRRLPTAHAAVARGPRRRKPGYPIVALVSTALDAAETSRAGAEQRAYPITTWPLTLSMCAWAEWQS